MASVVHDPPVTFCVGDDPFVCITMRFVVFLIVCVALIRQGNSVKCVQCPEDYIRDKDGDAIAVRAICRSEC